MDFRQSDLVNIMSNLTTYYQLPVLLVKLLDRAEITEISTLTLKSGHFRWEVNNSNNTLYKCKLHCMVPERRKKNRHFFNFGFYQFAPYWKYQWSETCCNLVLRCSKVRTPRPFYHRVTY